MPFTKTHQVLEEFFKVFFKEATEKPLEGDNRTHPFIPIELHSNQGVKDFMLRYYKRSGDSGVESVADYYPCVVIQDFQPEIDKTKLFGLPYVEGVLDELRGKREIIYFPIPLMYKFQVSGVTRRLRDVHSLNDWFMSNFDMEGAGFLLMNSIPTEEGDVGDVVRYDIEFNEVPREDGRFEYVYDFTLHTYLHAKAKESTFVIPSGSAIEAGSFEGGNFGDVIEKIKMNLQQLDYNEVKSTIIENFDIENSESDITGIIVRDNEGNCMEWSEIQW